MTRFAIYARYSSDLQNPKSIDDQILLCKNLINQHFSSQPIDIVAIYSDAEVSGIMKDRIGLNDLLEAVKLRQFDILVTEAQDRLSRSMKDIAEIYEVCSFFDVQLWTAHEGEIGEINIAFNGAMNSIYLKSLKQRLLRSAVGRVNEGLFPAGLVYGYRVVRDKFNEKGEQIKGLREIDPITSKTVQWIFKEYARGISVNQIIVTLNRKKVPSPSGGIWRSTTLKASIKRREGILYNELYKGVLIYNRRKTIIDPTTGRSKQIVKPENEWVRKEIPYLRIISDALWNKVEERNILTSHKLTKKPIKKPKAYYGHPLTGVIYCGVCNSQKFLANEGRYVCRGYRFKKTECKNARGTKEDELKELVFDLLYKQLKDSAIDWKLVIERAFNNEIDIINKNKIRSKKLNEDAKKLTSALINGVDLKPVISKMQDVQSELIELNVTKKQSFHPPFSTSYARDRMSEALKRIEQDFFLAKMAIPFRHLMALLIDNITCTPILTERSGETIDIKINPPEKGWPEFYRRIAIVWPDLE